MTFSGFRDLAQKVNVDEAYNDIQIEKLFNYVDSNGTDEVTRDEFYKVIFPRQYAEMIGNVYAKYAPDFEHIKSALRHQRRANLKEFFKTDRNVVTFELFMKSSSFLDFDPRSQRVFELMSAFEDQEKPHHVNIEKVKSV
jgi:Ca2+-binding EF-hand superfamily protein